MPLILYTFDREVINTEINSLDRGLSTISSRAHKEGFDTFWVLDAKDEICYKLFDGKFRRVQ